MPSIAQISIWLFAGQDICAFEDIIQLKLKRSIRLVMGKLTKYNFSFAHYIKIRSYNSDQKIYLMQAFIWTQIRQLCLTIAAYLRHWVNFSAYEIWYRYEKRKIQNPIYLHELQNHFTAMTKVHLTDKVL